MTHSNYDLIADLETNIAIAAWLELVIDDWTGPSSSSGDETGRHGTGSHSDPTGSSAITETTTRLLVECANNQLADLALLRQITSRMNARRGRLQPMRDETAKAKAAEKIRPTTQGWCCVCDTHCDGTSEYKSLKGGLDGACRKAFTRAWDKAQDQGATNRILFRDQWMKAEKARLADRHAAEAV